MDNLGDPRHLSYVRPHISVVVPCYNEEAVILETARRLHVAVEALGLSYEILYIDDGSRDSTAELLHQVQAECHNTRIVRLSRNFGHQIAITAGLEHATGDCVVLIDADLQDPPEVIGEMVAQWKAGWDVVYGVRKDRDGETLFKLLTAKTFYRLINLISSTPIPVDTGDFRLMDRKVVDALLAMPERDRFVRGMVSWVGYRQTGIPYERLGRFAGETKYPFRKMLHFAADGLLSFSVAPLKLATLLGFAVSIIAIIGSVVAIWNRVWTNHWVVGWTSLFLAVLLFGGVQLICLGIIGEYVGRTYGEVKHRPLYLVQERMGFPQPQARDIHAAAAGQQR